MWQSPVDIMIPDSGRAIKFPPHTVQVQIHNADSEVPISGCKVKVCCSTSAELLINGSTVRGSPQGHVMKTDEMGTLTIIVKSDGLATPILTVDDPSPKGKVFTTPLKADPVSKLWTTVDGLKTAKDLKEMTLPDGPKFVKAGIDETELEKAAKAFQDMSKIRREVEIPSGPGALAPQTTTNVVNTVTNRLWGAWYCIRDKIRQDFQWAIFSENKVPTRRKGWTLIWDITRSIVEVQEGENGERWEEKVGEFPENLQEIIAKGGLVGWVKHELAKAA